MHGFFLAAHWQHLRELIWVWATQRHSHTIWDCMLHQTMGGTWRVLALIELGLPGFTHCCSGGEWCVAFVQFMVCRLQA